MLTKFSFKNFKSFRDKATLDLNAAKITEFSDSVITIGGNKVLPAAAIFGANASGKSTVFSAFEYMSNYVAYSFNYGDEKEKFSKFRPTPFLFDKKSATAESEFEVYFTIPGDKLEKTYNYGFCINQTGVSKEWFNVKSRTARSYQTIFTRNGNTLNLPGIPQRSRENISISLEKQVLIISLGAKLRIDKCKIIRDWFLNNEFADFGNPFSNLLMSRMIPDQFVDDAQTQKKVIEYFNTFDNHIRGFNIKKSSLERDDNDDCYEICSYHNMIDSNDLAEIPLEEESAGTLKMFAIFPKLQEVLINGGVFFVDELNARLHPLLVRNILNMFINPSTNPNHAQLVFTTHDTWQMSNKIFRRDEIWFTEKDENGISKLYSLADYENSGIHIRKDENYEKNYLEGKYGSVPNTKQINMIEDN